MAARNTKPRRQAPRKAPRKMAAKVADIDAYLAGLDGERLAALQRLRKTLRALLPRAEECISYGLPAFRVDDDVVAGFAATRKGCSYYPFSSATLTTLANDLSGYLTTKGALQFDARKPLPTALVRKLIKVRLAEIRAK
jgi:uncharacterized protein YdhG (YjbR/CyaY superfamily)